MKKIIFFLLTVIAVACEPGTPKNEAAKNAGAVNYAYTIKNPDYWEIGSTANTAIALNALKAWELGKMDSSISFFGDSVQVMFDGLDKKLPKDSVKVMFSGLWNSYKSVSIKMDDWESVISKDKTEEWVTIWYKQLWETKEGIKDSSAIINDFNIKNGKIVKLSEYTRKLH